MQLSEREKKALIGLCEFADSDFSYSTFKMIAANGRLPLKHVRRSVRALARKGLAVYGKGLSDEDGGFWGSGYAATDEGRSLFQSLVEER